ncbi:hypothetical protein [Wenjunlia vitaminophila]|uniref:hypothetical protein n=1 Tax=Wenjunlia vitaminophila TaxID=76728 RepID=UPI000365FD47|nr:hypothetical protein [Wenjunlia vitaminophila]
MPEMSNRLPELMTVAAQQSGNNDPGVLLKWVLVISVIGIAFLAWFLLRGYRNED